MKKENRPLGLLSLLLVLSLLLTTSWPAQGAEALAGPEVSTSFGNTVFNLYQIAEKDPAGAWQACPPFQGYAVDLRLDSDEGKRQAAETLVAYISRDRLSPLQAVRADAGGKASFAAVPAGLYLVTGDSSQDGSGRRPVPTLLEWPAQKGANAPIRPKYEVPDKPVPPDQPGKPPKPDDLTIHALKKWDDREGADRPKSVQVQLVQDGKVIETATLSAENNWQKDWYRLPRDHSYHVVEKTVPAGYSLRIDREGWTFTLTNSRTEAPPKPLPKDPPTHHPPADQPPQKPPQKPTPKLPPATGPKIPQTGQLWWPVMALALLGLGFSLKAYRASKNPQEDDQ
ncbi:Cna B-type domain-containing protein [Peptococcus simiae]|uniref:Cna B-type domain-containing protein n=1 Tax=Peptococcus simiae TaxID=1643805 RepID=A0ABW9H0J9_9FIRM